jgi:hypothetical protein
MSSTAENSTTNGNPSGNNDSSNNNSQQSNNTSNNTNQNQHQSRNSKNKKKKWNNKKNSNKKKSTVSFNGTISEMNGHVFQCQSENPPGNQFLRTLQELRSYVSIQLNKYPHDIIYILKHMEECQIKKPASPGDKADRTDTRIWEKEVDKYVDRKDYYKQNKAALYAIIWAQCSLPMQAKLKSLAEYNMLYRNDDCLGLINSIRAISMKFESHDYLYKAMYMATKKFYNYRQGHSETEAEYMANFKDLLDAIIYYGGSLGEDPVLVRAELINLGHDMDSYDSLPPKSRTKMNLDLGPGSSEYKRATKLAQEKFFAVSFLMSSDPRRYKNLLIELENDHSKGIGNYPTTLTAAYSLLVNYRTQSFQQSNKHHASDNDGNGGSDDDVSFLTNGFVPTCHHCGKKGHIAPKCPLKLKQASTQSGQTTTQNDTQSPASPAAATQSTGAVQMLMHASNDANAHGLDFSFNPSNNLARQSNNYSSNFCFTHLSIPYQNITTSQQIILRNGGFVDPHWILLDTQSTVDLFNNRALLKNIRKCSGPPLRCYCNGGFQDSTLIGTLDGYGDVWYNPNSLANILSMAHVSEHFRVNFDTDIEQAIFVWRKDGTFIKFIRSQKGLYYHDIRWGTKQPDGPTASVKAVTFVQTIADNKKPFTPRDVEKADLAKRIYEMVGRPSYRDFCNMIKFQMIQNCPITVRDVQTAEAIYGKDVYAVRGKTVRRQPSHVRDDVLVPVPPSILTHYRKITLCIDLFFIDKIPFFTTISRKILFMTVEPLSNRKLSTIFKAVAKVVHIYRARNFQVQFIFADNEFKGLRAKILELKIYLNCAAANEHVPEIERAIRVIKERVRATISSLPFRALPFRFTKELVSHLVTCLNMFPRRGGVSNNLSPRTLICGLPIDYNLQCRVPFGAYCEVHDEHTPTNTMESRTTPAVSLGPTGNLQGTYKFYSLQSRKMIVRRHWTELPMPDRVISLVESIARSDLKLSDSQSLPDRPIFLDRTKHVISDEDVIYMHDNHPFDSVNDTYTHQQDEGAISIQSDDDESSVQDDGISFSSDNSNSTNIDENENDDDGDDISYDTNSSNDSINQGAPNDDITQGAPDVHNNDNGESIDEQDNNDTSSFESIEEINAEIDEANIIPNTGVNKTYNLRSREHIAHLNVRAPFDYSNRYGYAAHMLMVQVSAKKGLKMFGERAAMAIITEFKQLHDKSVFKPVHMNSVPYEERKKALRAITLVQEKRCGKIKGRTVADGSTQRTYINAEEAASPTVSLEALMITSAIDASEKRDVATADISGAFLQADIDELVLVMFEGVMVDLLIKTDPIYGNFVHTTKQGKKLLYVKLTKAMYGCMKAARLFYENLSTYLIQIGFVINEYDMCTANKIIDGKQCTIVWHVDDLKISHVDPNVVTNIIKQLESKYGEMSVTRGPIHTYVGIDFDFKESGVVEVNMHDYIKECINDFPEEITKSANTPAASHLFDVNEECAKLDEKQSEIFHKIVAKLLFACKRARPDIQTAVAFLTTRVTKSDADDWKKLKRCLQYLYGTKDLKLTLSASNLTVIKWWVDASYAIHPNMKSHTGAALSLGRGIIFGKSAKQKLNTKSSTEAEIVGVSDISSQIFWTLYFLMAQGYDISENRLYQDNKSSILLEKNGRISSGQRTRHINIRYFFIKDRVEKEEVNIVYCPTEYMVADFFTKPLQGKLFIEFRNKIMGIDNNPDFTQERVGS